MNGYIGKFSLGMGVYWQAWQTVRRQYHPDQILKTQRKRLHRLIQHCSTIKYYRELFKQANLQPDLIRSAEDLVRIPTLSRQELRQRFWDFLPNRIPACRVARTSGSTGMPICVLSDQRARLFNSAAVIRNRLALGIPLVGGPIITPQKAEGSPPIPPHWSYIQGVHRTYHVNPYSDNAHDIDAANITLNHIRNPTIIGIASAVRTLAERVKDGIFPPLSPRAILTLGEDLTTNMRYFIESVLGTRVSDVYACSEIGDIAWQCSQASGYHINADNCIVEILHENEPVRVGEVGDVTVTNLNRYAMPLLRYKNGDRAQLTDQPCPCGCRLPMIKELLGRTGDNVVLPDGQIFFWNHLKSHMTHPHVHQFQILQNRDGNIAVQYVPDPEGDLDRLDSLLYHRFQGMVGDSIQIKIDRVREIPQAASGKSKLVVSHYKPQPECS